MQPKGPSFVLLNNSTISNLELRHAVRTSTWKRDSSQHVHDFPAEGEAGGEVYDEESDTWTKTCRTCGHGVTYEKM